MPTRCFLIFGGTTVLPLHGMLFRMIPEMFHVKHFRPVPAQNLTRRKTAGALDEIRPAKILVR
jgi:hypothetical protein